MAGLGHGRAPVALWGPARYQSRDYAMSRPQTPLAIARSSRQGWPRSGGHPKGSSLYEAFEVKHYFEVNHYFTAFFTFFISVSLFLRPDPHVLEVGARRGCQGRPSLYADLTLHCFQAEP